MTRTSQPRRPSPLVLLMLAGLVTAGLVMAPAGVSAATQSALEATTTMKKGGTVLASGASITPGEHVSFSTLLTMAGGAPYPGSYSAAFYQRKVPQSTSQPLDVSRWTTGTYEVRSLVMTGDPAYAPFYSPWVQVTVLGPRPFTVLQSDGSALPSTAAWGTVLSVRASATGPSPIDLSDATVQVASGTCTVTGWHVTLGANPDESCVLSATAPAVAGEWTSQTITLPAITTTRRSQEIELVGTVPESAEATGTWTPTLAPTSAPGEVALGTVGDHCFAAQGAVTFRSAGPCTVTWDRAADTHWQGATRSAQIEVTHAPVAVVAVQEGVARLGGPATLRVRATAAGSPLTGTWQLEQAGSLVPGVSVSEEGADALLTWTPAAAGDHQVTARFTPSESSVHAVGAQTSTVTVERGTGTVTGAIAPTAVAAQVTLPPGDVTTPRGSVRFTAGALSGTVPVDAQGRAVWVNPGLDATTTQTVTLDWTGDDHHLPAGGSVTRNVPTILTTLSAAKPPVGGWYAGPVTVTFTCSGNGGTLVAGACPAPVELVQDGRDLSASGTVTTAEGARATARVSGINVDTRGPSVRITGATNGAEYRGRARTVSCAGTDAGVGLGSCTISTTRTGDSYRVTARARDLLGHASTTTLTYSVRTLWVAWAPLEEDTFVVKRGAPMIFKWSASPTRPTLYLPTAPGRAPTRKARAAAVYRKADGIATWQIAYRAPKQYRKGQVIRLGFKVPGRTMQVVKVRLR